MNRNIAASLIAATIYVGIRTYRYFSKRNRLRQLKLKAEQQKVVADVLFFRASKEGCKSHVYGQKICYNMDCPFRKMRFIVDTLGASLKSLDVCIHLFTSIDIAKCLIDCHRRGVKIRIICDYERLVDRGSQIRSLSRAGIAVKYPVLNFCMHSKVAIVDGMKVMAGSANWTLQGFCSNWDNVLVTSQPDIVEDMVVAFDLMWNNPDVKTFS